MPSVRIVVCVFLASCFFNDVASYNPYAYNPSYFPAAYDNSQLSMGDIDWTKRSLEDEDENESNPLEDEIATSLELKRSPYTYRSYKYRQPYMLPRRPSRTAISRTAYSPYRAYARYGAIPRPQGRQYAYASMADADWGWKKRSQLPALMGTNTEDAEEVLANALDKRNLASLAKNNFFPREYKRSQDTDTDDSDVIEEEKRHVSSLNRSGRSASSLARSGELRGRK
jgi:hypothetical protein